MSIAAEWIAKAEGDFAMVLRESRARKSPNYDGLCFHAQQCAEKYLKAVLTKNGIAFGNGKARENGILIANNETHTVRRKRKAGP